MCLYHSVQIGALSLEGNIFLAPVAGYSDRAFRSICIEQGANFTFTELVSSEAMIRSLVYNGKNNEKNPTATLLRRADNEAHYGVQLFGANPEVMGKAAAMLAPWNPSAVDINAGCPVPKVVKTGAGAALMKNPAHLGRIVEAVVNSSQTHLGDVPVTVKMRSGWDAESINCRECARIAVEAGADMITLHSRTRSQMYSGKSDWAHIADLAACIPAPVAGSGDLFSPEDAKRMMEKTKCAAVMFARGAMGDPFIFTATRDLLTKGFYTTPGAEERIAAGFRQLLLLSADIGEGAACREMRKQFCAYTRGMTHGAEMRNRLVHAATIAEYERILGCGV
ncbi:MAG: tRNA dihydrouridine synthase DusB [Treponema sp.]|jgi:nifR3 family TIM-barrel protein|nr:tRNA dihydrouridine synthase DusB [Treponema sp.]